MFWVKRNSCEKEKKRTTGRKLTEPSKRENSGSRGRSGAVRSELDGRSARKAHTRDALLGAGRALFAEEPVDAISIDTVVARAGVAKGSFYNHFADRQALVEAVVADIRFALQDTVARVNAGETDAAHRVARAVCVFFRYAIDEPQGAGALARIHGSHIAVDASFNSPVVADISLGIAGGRFHIPTLECGVLLIIGVVQVGMQRILNEPVLALSIATAQQLTMLILRGLGVEGAEAEGIAAQAADAIVRAGFPDGPAASGGEVRQGA
jgi:AcrR family transcriptional regulator